MPIATLPMYDLPELKPATDALWAAVAANLHNQGIDAPRLLTRGEDLNALWQDSTLLLGQTCGYPLVTSLAGKVRVVATPCYLAEGCEGAFYRSAVVVRAADGAATLADLRGRRCAVNDAASNSGMNVLRAAIAPIAGGARRFFSEVVMTGAHAASVAAVAEGRADVAAIDCVTWAHLCRWRQADAGRLRVLAWTAATPGLPLVTAAATPDKLGLALLRALDAVAADTALTHVRKTLLLGGFALMAPNAYEQMLALEHAAAASGYPFLQ